MKIASEVAGSAAIGLKWLAQAAAGGAAGLATTAVHDGANNALLFSAGLLALSGACAVSGAMFYSAREGETAARDSMVTLIFPFVLAVAIGPAVGDVVLSVFPEVATARKTALASHMLGGLVIGAFVTPAFRAGLARLKKLSGGA